MAQKEENTNTRIGLFISKKLVTRCNDMISKTNALSRSEFICDAIDFYIAWLNCENNSKVLTPALESVISARITDTENRLARVLFKQAVEVAMMMHVVAGTNNIDQTKLAELRRLCVDEVSRLSGRYNFEDAVKFQKD
jgi:metal-responsive CopG/Arc/MetJ family transcriptional regulator